MVMSNDAMREAFDEWIKDSWVENSNEECYASDALAFAWLAWQAALAAPAQSEAKPVKYTHAMGEAAERYYDSFKYAHKLPATFRWETVFVAMMDALNEPSAAPAGDGGDAELLKVVDERDAFEAWADQLANAIGEHLDIDIGEHTSANIPWLNALEAIQNARHAPTGADAHDDTQRLIAIVNGLASNSVTDPVALALDGIGCGSNVTIDEIRKRIDAALLTKRGGA